MAGQQVVIKVLDSKFGPSILAVRLAAQVAEDTDGNTDAENREDGDGYKADVGPDAQTGSAAEEDLPF